MRTLVSILIAALGLLASVSIASELSAKTVVQITPTSGPPGSVLEVEGFGFPGGDVRIALGPSEAAGSGFMDILPEEDLVTLEVVPAVRGTVEPTAVTLPGAHDFPWRDQVDILAIVENPPTSNLKYYVASTTFNVIPAALADAGSGPIDRESGDVVWLMASLVAFGAVLTLAGLRLRIATAG